MIKTTAPSPRDNTTMADTALKDDKKESSVRKQLETTLQSLDTVLTNFSDRKRRRSEPPLGLEEPYKELYSLLHPCLVERKPNVAALVMGMRGSGKTLVVDHAIDSLASEAHFRVVRLNGLVVRGDDVGAAVKEILRQLADIAMMENAETSIKSPGRQKKVQNLLRLRNTSFTSQMELLDEALQMASIDGIPILMVLDEFDALLKSSVSAVDTNLEAGINERQVLLYHLLDRVTTRGSSLCLVAITSHLAAVGMLEKRVKSRAEGSSKIIYVHPCSTYDDLVKILLSKFQGQDDTVGDLRTAVSDIISSPASNMATVDEKRYRVQLVFERNYRLQKDMRWFCRVVSCALALHREDCASLLRRRDDPTNVPKLSQDHFCHALVAMNASFPNEVTTVGGGMVAVDPRMQALLDLSGPQVALVLAARRILARDSHTEVPKPLTLQRMLQEYQSYRGPHRYNERLLSECFLQLLETDVLRPSADHTGGGPLQYAYNQHYYAMDSTTMSRMPLHLPVEIDVELGEALKNNLLECSTALREWGKKKN